METIAGKEQQLVAKHHGLRFCSIGAEHLLIEALPLIQVGVNGVYVYVNLIILTRFFIARHHKELYGLHGEIDGVGPRVNDGVSRGISARVEHRICRRMIETERWYHRVNTRAESERIRVVNAARIGAGDDCELGLCQTRKTVVFGERHSGNECFVIFRDFRFVFII